MLHQTPPPTGLIKVRQELPITHHHYPLESALFMRKNQSMRPFLQKALLFRDLCNNGRCQNWHARHIVSQPFEMGDIEAIQRTATHRKRWQPHETQVLIAAKKEIESVIVENGSKRKRKRWEDIEIFCQTKGVDRTAQQCKERWDRLMVLYSQIRCWENSHSAERSSFWSMDLEERKSNGFLMGIDQESYAALDELCNKEGIAEIIAETSFGSNVERKVEDGDNADDLQAEGNVLAQANPNNVHDEGHMVEKSGFKPAIKSTTNTGMFEANAIEFQATTDSIKEVCQKIDRGPDSSSIAVNPFKGLSNATAYIDVDKIDEDNAPTSMTLNQMEEHLEAVVLHTTEKHIKAGNTINLQRNDKSVEENVNPTLKGLISHFPQSESSSGESASISPVAQPFKGLDLAEDIETENINKIQKPENSKGLNLAEDSKDSSFLCKENNAMSRQLPNAISLQGNLLHSAQGEYLSGNHTIISSLDTHAKDILIGKVIPIEANCKEVSLSEDDIHTKDDYKSKRLCDNGHVEDNYKGASLSEEEDIHSKGDDKNKRTRDDGKAYDSRQSLKQFEANETSMSSSPELVIKENSCVKTCGQKITLENEVKNAVFPSRNEMQEVDASSHCKVPENISGNMGGSRIEKVSYDLKVPEKLSMEGNLDGSSMEVGSDTRAKSIKGLETSKVGNEERKQKNTTTTTKYSELDDDIFVYIQSAFANLVKFVSQTITRVFKG